ncbi:MAG: hypothetical protein Q9M36_06460 [Sulfurovum sp.]|nr:hypothetical protein [Sulfurovum sp.]
MYFYLKIYLLLMLLPLSLWASPSSKYEIEPNDLAVNATVFRGSTTLLGTLHPNEEDHFLWKVSKKDAKSTWDLVLAPLSNANISIEVSKVLFQKAGLSTVSFSKKAKELKEKTTLFHFANESKSQKRTLTKLLVEKGEYLISITSTELNISQPYSFALLKQKNILYKSGESKKKAKRISLQKNTTLYESIANDAWFTFEIKEKESNKLWQIDTSSLMGKNITLELFSSSDKIQTLSFDSYGKASLDELELDSGVYTVHFKTQSKKSDKKNTNKYMLQIHSIGLQSIDKDEQEPNNEFKKANKIKITKTIHATISYKEDNYDYFVFTLPSTLKDTTLNIQLQTQSPDITFTLYDSNRKQLQVKNSDSNYTMNALHLVAKKYYYLKVSPTYSLKGTQAYTLDFTIGKESNSSSEKEPNDKHVQAPIIDPTQTINGTFTGAEYDCFGFDITRNNLFWSMKAEGTSLEYLYLYQGDKEILRSSNLLDKKLVFNNLYLSSGHYVLCVYGKSDRYSIDIDHKNYDELNLSKENLFEHEPNQSSTQANHLPWERTTQGVLDNPDHFYFTLKNDAHLRLSASRPTTEDIYMKLIGPQNINQRVSPNKGRPSIIEGTYPAGRYTVTLSTNTRAYDYYSLKLERLNPFETKEKDANTTASNDISIELHSIQQDVASYVEEAQRMDFELIVSNEGNVSQTFDIQKHSSDQTWQLTFKEPYTEESSITLDKGTTKTIHTTVSIPKNVAMLSKWY